MIRNVSDYALELAAKKIPVFPCRANKAPATARGFKDASLDDAKIKNWFTNAAYLLAVPTGPVSGLFVLDIDPDGADWLASNSEQLNCERSHTTKRGKHFVYRWPERGQAPLKNTAGKLAPGVDTRGEGGYVIWWPAHDKGYSGDLDALTEPPAWLLDALIKPERQTEPQHQDGLRFIEGQRNDGLFKHAGTLRRNGLSEDQIRHSLRSLNESSCTPPLDDTEVASIAHSVARYEAGAPIQTMPIITSNNSLDWLEDFEMTDAEVDAITDPGWVTENLIPEGHVVAVVSPPNGGKTTVLFHLCKSITSNHKVVYVHADAHPAEAKEKYFQAKESGFRYLTPDFKVGLSMEDVVGHLEQLAASDADLKGQVWFFDTLKKMTNVIQKAALKDLLQTMRKLSARGMTIVLVAHTNKHKDSDGKTVYEGTGDLRADVDELIYLDPIENPEGGLTISTRPDKVRAIFEPLTFELDADRNVSLKEKFVDVPIQLAQQKKLSKDLDIIEIITDAIHASMHKQADIISYCKAEGGFGEHRIRRVLREYSKPPNRRWIAKKQLQNNAYRYQLVSAVMSLPPE
jgi:hypothetical protein